MPLISDAVFQTYGGTFEPWISSIVLISALTKLSYAAELPMMLLGRSVAYWRSATQTLTNGANGRSGKGGTSYSPEVSTKSARGKPELYTGTFPPPPVGFATAVIVVVSRHAKQRTPH
jgi:hypothetical protein